MKVFHATSSDAAPNILRDGFRDTPAHWGFEQEAGGRGGVWLSDTPVDENEGARSGDVQLGFDVPEDLLAGYEAVEEDHPNRTFIVPAEVLNKFPARIAAEEEQDEAKAARWRRLFPDVPWHANDVSVSATATRRQQRTRSRRQRAEQVRQRRERVRALRAATLPDPPTLRDPEVPIGAPSLPPRRTLMPSSIPRRQMNVMQELMFAVSVFWAVVLLLGHFAPADHTLSAPVPANDPPRSNVCGYSTPVAAVQTNDAGPYPLYDVTCANGVTEHTAGP